MKDYLGTYVDLLVQKYGNREYAIYYVEEHEDEPFRSRGEAIFEHETRSKKNIWYRYYSWDNNSQNFLTKAITKKEVADILKDAIMKRKINLTNNDIVRFKDFGVEI